MHKGKIIRVFPGVNTPEGFRSFAGDALQPLQRVFIIKGGPGCGQSSLIGVVARSMVERGYDVELWQGTLSPDAAEGVVIPHLGVAVVDGSAFDPIEPQYPGVRDEIINLGEYWNRQQLRRHCDEIRQLTDDLADSIGNIWHRLGECAGARRRLRQIYGGALSEAELMRICRGLAEEIFGEQQLRIRRFFSGAVGIDGWESTAQQLSSACRRRWLVYGPSGEAVSAALEEMQRQAVSRGHNVDLYYSCFRPDQLEMVIIPGASVALIDSSLPDLEPMLCDRLLKLADLPGEDAAEEDAARENAAREEILEERWQEELAAAVADADAAWHLYERLEGFYRAAMDHTQVDAAAKALLEKIWSMAAEREDEQAGI